MESPNPAQPRQALKRITSLILHQWLLIGIGIVCALAYYFPNVAKHGGIIRSEYSIMYGVIAIIFLISGLSIPRQKLISQVLNWRLHVIVQVISFLFIPALVLAIVHIILAADSGGKIDRAVLAGYIFTACIPTTIASNVVMTRSAGGDDAAALVEVLLANILGPFVTAAWTVALMPKSVEFEPWRSRRWSKPIFKRMSPEETIAVCFCGPAKSTALGIPLLYAMWQPVDLFLKAKTSVPVLLYTTEQICVAHFFVQLFRWWHTRIVEKEDLDDTGDDVEIGMAVNSRGDHAGRGHEHTTV
ncbi:putative sodium bile acid cotransporter [Penicillium griseofulvum]|uniref:Putative sodium bile acid cotransporter n=1 Tax=Penicillium patulum TaxID=5078 RepID=A0A135LUU8_PENPA|nr:putative sodium bile acid cotransporter [Penicillium griseofulvum]KXG52726.1 putative sodium bile acid cotransporter [Penicillium griseofulvum]